MWRMLGNKYNADRRVIECVCSNDSLHRERLEQRQRGIPGWHELKWSDVEFVRSYYAPWNEEHLIVDSINSVEQNFLAALKYCQ
jgi:hypothetical protein